MKQRELAAVFAQMADLLEYRGDNPFRVRAYRRAAQNLESFSGDLEELASRGRLRELSGIGADLADKITTYLLTGQMAALERLKGGIPSGVLGLLAVPGVGPKTAKALTERLRIATVDELEAVARRHRLRALHGFGEKKNRTSSRASRSSGKAPRVSIWAPRSPWRMNRRASSRSFPASKECQRLPACAA